MRSDVYVSRFLRAFFPVMLIVLLLTGTGLFAQERFSTINGVVYDSSKAVLQGAEVTITNLESKRAATLTTGDNGRYLARDLEPGRYSVSAQKTGFSKAEYPEIILLLGKTINLDFTLQIGQVKETIVVSGSLTMIDTSTTAVTHNVTSDEFDAMPKGRSFQDVALTAPSVNSGKVEGGIQVNGASGAENQFTIDGISTTSTINGSSRQDAAYEYLQEVQVKTSGIEAEYGGALGGVISAVTKSGGNAYHGEFHWYNSGSPWNAIQNKRLQVDPVGLRATGYFQDQEIRDHINEFGGSVGGYILKDKLFFFTSYSPSLRYRSADYTFADVKSTFKSTQKVQNLFNKISWEPTKRIRSNFTWLYTTTEQDGLIPTPNSMTVDTNTKTSTTYATSRVQGWYLPKNSYTGTVDVTLSNTSLLSLRGGYFWDNFKDLNTPSTTQVYYNTGNVGLAGVPADLQHISTWYNIPVTSVNHFDITTRAFFQADYSVSFRALGTHTFKAGVGMQKNINTVSNSYQGDGSRVFINWDDCYNSKAFGDCRRGTYGYYTVRLRGTTGSAGSTIDNIYIQDQWRIHPRLTLSLGLRTEKEGIPSMRQDIRPGNAIQFGFGDKIAPRLGASLDVLGNGKLKVFGSWGVFYDWTKYTLVRGSFGGDTWREWYHALDSLDIFSLNLNNKPGANLFSSDPDSFYDLRFPSFGPTDIDPNIKPMRQQTSVIGTEYQLNPMTVISANWVHSRLNRTIEDIGHTYPDGTIAYPLGNPGEGIFKLESNHTALNTPDFPMPKPKREYDALQLIFSRRFASRWFLGANYTYSRLYGNYSGISDTDEIQAAGWAATQDPASKGPVARDGSNTNLFYDADVFMATSKGIGTEGRLPSDRPHVFKAFGSYAFKFGTSISADFYVGSGTPMTTMAEAIMWNPMFVEGRGDMGRTPVLSQTDMMVAHEIKIREGKTLRFEFNLINLFNQRQVRHIDPLVNRFRTNNAGMNVDDVNLLNGFDWKALISQSYYAQYNVSTNPLADPTKWYYSTDGTSLDPLKSSAINPTYNKADIWNDPFAGRFGLKFTF